MNPYVIIWFFLIVLLGISIALGYVGNVLLATILIFAIAIVKAYLVAAYYMRLKYEPRYVTGILLIAVVFLFILSFALVPDIIYVYGGS